jgi:hypothetical protein
MAKRICQIEGCERLHYARGWCERHWKRWWHHGDPIGGRIRQTGQCTIEGCDKPLRYPSYGWCRSHYNRWYDTGDPGDTTFRRPTGTWIQAGRYMVHVPDHPLGRGAGGIHAARIVLFDKIGYGPHRCHWCRIPITWCASTYTGLGAQIHADHVNGDTLDDRRENLVQSCPSCNGKRSDPRWVKPLCTVDGCGREHKARGYCSMHYARALRAGEVGR